MSAKEFREHLEEDIQRWALRGSRSIYAWAVRRGDVEVRRQIDESAIYEALALLQSVDLHRYPSNPEIKSAVRDAVSTVRELAWTSSERWWPLYHADLEATAPDVTR